MNRQRGISKRSTGNAKAVFYPKPRLHVSSVRELIDGSRIRTHAAEKARLLQISKQDDEARIYRSWMRAGNNPTWGESIFFYLLSGQFRIVYSEIAYHLALFWWRDLACGRCKPVYERSLIGWTDFVPNPASSRIYTWLIQQYKTGRGRFQKGFEG